MSINVANKEKLTEDTFTEIKDRFVSFNVVRQEHPYFQIDMDKSEYIPTKMNETKKSMRKVINNIKYYFLY